MQELIQCGIRGGGGGKVLLNVQVLTLKSNATDAICRFTVKKMSSSFLFSPNPQAPSREIISIPSK